MIPIWELWAFRVIPDCVDDSVRTDPERHFTACFSSPTSARIFTQPTPLEPNICRQGFR